MPRKTLNIDGSRVTELAAKGHTNKEIGMFLGCCHDVIERRFAKELATGRTMRDANLRSKQVEVALAGNPTMLIWLGKQYLGQKDKREIEEHKTSFTLGDLPTFDMKKSTDAIQ